MHYMTSLLNAVPPLAAFTFVMAITPGPNNFMLLSSGARFGMRRTTAHLLGVTGGFLGIVLIAYAGVGTLIEAYPTFKSALTVACVLYLAWLGYQLLREGFVREAIADASAGTEWTSPPLTWLQAALFQLANPKGWGAAVAAVGIVARDTLPPASRLLLLLGVTAAIIPPCTVAWALFGASLRPFLRIRWIHLAFNVSMATLVLITAWWMAGPLLHSAVTPP